MKFTHEQLAGLTQPERLMLWLRTGESITPLQAWLELGIYRVADPVHKLRKKGVKIDDEAGEVKNRFGEICHVSIYRLRAAQPTEQLALEQRPACST